jgi:hypothetical protein
VIPEGVYTRSDYDRQILQRIYRDIAPHDREQVLQHEWLNARGAIARFQRQTIEIRVLDVQECPYADLAICAATIGVLKGLVGQQWSPSALQMAIPVQPLAELLQRTMRDAERTVIEDEDYLRLFGLNATRPRTAGQLWQHLIEQSATLQPDGERWQDALRLILNQGPLARRIERRLDGRSDLAAIEAVYRQLCDCLSRGEMFQ